MTVCDEIHASTISAGLPAVVLAALAEHAGSLPAGHGSHDAAAARRAACADPVPGLRRRILPVHELWITNFSAIMPVAPPRTVRNALPLDQLEISFDSR